ncbi:MAG: hypothetical protein GIW99_01840 [Candidatus Eremiobacteraeota bacterium]|nr:hypothetical protein [Candidatus Eremiobacteraeota bacterium]
MAVLALRDSGRRRRQATRVLAGDPWAQALNRFMHHAREKWGWSDGQPWSYQMWAVWFALNRHHKMLPNVCDRLEHRMNMAKMQGLSADQFDVQLRTPQVPA